jgi:hypothetical protein
MEEGRLEEGWYSDPYGLHDARWYSVGRPTALVRDGRTEGKDPPPDGPPPHPPEPLPQAEAPDGTDLRRADEVDRAWDPDRASDVAMDVSVWTGGGHA